VPTTSAYALVCDQSSGYEASLLTVASGHASHAPLPDAPALMAGIRALAAAGAVAAMIAGCSGGTSPSTPPAGKITMASFSKAGLSFRYPAAWTVKQWPLWMISDETTITYLTQARLHNPCKRSTNAYGGVGVSCQGGVLNALPPGDVFIVWSIFGSDPEPATGKHEMIDEHRAIVSYHDTFVRGMTRGAQVGIAAAIPTGTGNWYEMEACLRGPGLRQAEAEVRAMLRSVRFHQTG
jgi:hypothetical protein